MYEFAQEYITANGVGDHIPQEVGALCALCQQPLSPEASARLEKFQKFVMGETAKAAKSAKAAVSELVVSLKNLSIYTPKVVKQNLAEYATLSEDRADFAKKIVEYFGASNVRRDEILSAISNSNFGAVSPLPHSLSALVKMDVAAMNAEGDANETKVASDTKRLQNLVRLSELKDQKLLCNNLETVLARQATLEDYSKLSECSQLVGTQQLSMLITAIRRKLVAKELGKKIQTEIDNFDLGHIPFTVTDQSRDGNSHFEVNLKAAVPVINSKILSEGEQRALALACYLGEVAGDAANHGLIIDDPVSSLDHLRIRKVARRLVEEASKRKQIIIFTHNMLFFNEIREAAAEIEPPIPVRLQIIAKSEALGFGVISDNEPWAVQPVTMRTQTLKNRLNNIVTTFSDFDTDEFRGVCKDFYTDLRETWERLVEEVLLDKVVERFSSEVKTQRLKRVFVENDDYKTIFWAMKRVSERSGHDKPVGKQIPTPTPMDMESDLNAITNFRTKIATRGKKLNDEREALEKAPVGVVS